MEIRPPRVDHPEFPTNNAVMRETDPANPVPWPAPPPEILNRMIRPLTPLHLDQLRIGMEVATLDINAAWRLSTITDIAKREIGPPNPTTEATITMADGFRWIIFYRNYRTNPFIWFYRVKMSAAQSRVVTELSVDKNLPYNVTSNLIDMLTGYRPKRAIPLQPRPLTAEEQEERATQETLAAMRGGRTTKTSRRTRKQKRSRRVKRGGVRLGTRRIRGL